MKVFMIILISFGGLAGDIRYEQETFSYRDCIIAAESIKINPGKFYRNSEEYTYNNIDVWCEYR
jgi:hypothetical protein